VIKSPVMSGKQQTKKPARIQIIQGIPFGKAVLLVGAVNLALGIIIFFFNDYLPPVVPFFYGEALGEGQLTSSLGLLLAPLLSILVLVTNSLLSTLTPNVFFKKILIGGAFLFALLMFITTAKIIFLVGFF
jgi:hypothetical protein